MKRKAILIRQTEIPPNTQNIIGQRFGKFTITGYVGSKGSQGSVWSSKCQCGLVLELSRQQLKEKAALNLGCKICSPKPKYEDLIGRRFGKLTVIKYAGKAVKETSWVCRCDCGKIITIRARSLKQVINPNCGECTPALHGSEHHAWQGHGEISQNLWRSYQNSAKDRKLEFNISIEYAWELFLKQERRCAYTGWGLYFNKTFKNQKDRTASLDRIDSTKGYIEGNVHWVHRIINKLKKNLPHEDFIKICIAVAKHQGV
jgi:hypothetical protein